MEELFQKGIAPATERLYGAGARRYSNFCKTYHRQPIPATEGTLCMFVAHLTREGLSHGTAKSYLSAVRNWQVKAGFGDPKTGNMPRLGQTLKGLQRLRTEQGVIKRQRKPMTLEGLETLRRSWTKVPGGGDARMLWAAATLCFFGFTRSGELTSPSAHECDPAIHLQWEDVTTDCEKHPTRIRVRIKASKTDQLRQGCTLVVGCTDDMLCPVRAVLAFQEARTTISIRVGPSSDSRWTGSRDEGSLGESRHEQHGLLWSQLPNWSSDGSFPGRDWGRDNPETGTLEEQCIQAVCTAGAGRAGRSPAADGDKGADETQGVHE